MVTGPGNRRDSDAREHLPMVERLHGQVESAAACGSDSSAPWIGLPRMGYKIVKRARGGQKDGPRRGHDLEKP